MKTKHVRVGLEDHEIIIRWANNKGLTVQDIIHCLVNGAKSIEYHKTYQAFINKCNKNKGAS